MNAGKVVQWGLIALLILFIIWCAELILGLAFGLIGLSFAFVGGVIGLLFSKTGMALIIAGLVVYILSRRERPRQELYY